MNINGRKILLIEDNKNQAQAITDRLSWLGCIVKLVYTGDSGLAAAKKDHPDVIILDIKLATEDEGFYVLREIQADPVACTIPIIVYSITAEEMDNRIRGLGLGAMWCLGKKDGLTELEATVRRALEFRQKHQRQPPTPSQMPLYFDNGSGTVWIDGQKQDIKLSALQRNLLAFLFERHGLICSRDDIATHVYDSEVSNQTIDRLVSRLRQKLGDDPQSPRFIENVRGVGYKMPGEKE